MNKPTMQRGVYGIFNKQTGRVYIGISTRMPKRWREHVLQLSHASHSCRDLQKDWITFGADAFDFRVLEDGSATPLEEWPPVGVEARWHAHFGPLVYGRRSSVGAGNLCGPRRLARNAVWERAIRKSLWE